MRGFGVITSSGHSQVESVYLCKNTPEQASGEGDHLSPPWCEVFEGRKITNVSAMRRQTSAVPVRATLAFFKGTHSPALGFFNSPSEMFEKRWLLRRQCLEASCQPSQEGEIIYQLFSQGDYPVLPPQISTQRVRSLPCLCGFKSEIKEQKSVGCHEQDPTQTSFTSWGLGGCWDC